MCLTALSTPCLYLYNFDFMLRAKRGVYHKATDVQDIGSFKWPPLLAVIKVEFLQKGAPSAERTL